MGVCVADWPDGGATSDVTLTGDRGLDWGGSQIPLLIVGESAAPRGQIFPLACGKKNKKNATQGKGRKPSPGFQAVPAAGFRTLFQGILLHTATIRRG